MSGTTDHLWGIILAGGEGKSFGPSSGRVSVLIGRSSTVHFSAAVQCSGTRCIVPSGSSRLSVS